MKRYDELDFTDDFMFCKVLADNEEICRELLELILDIKIRKVVVNRQEEISITADAKSVRFDVYAEDDANTVFDVEMETTKKRNLPKRSRYYQGMIDLNIIEKGADYKSLKKSYVIFICLKDPFDRGLPIYTFENRCNQSTDLFLGDGTVKVFLNASGTADDVSPELTDFLFYLTKKKGNSPLVQKIDAQVKKAQEHEEWKVEYMTLQMKFRDIYDDAWDEGRQDGLEQGLEQGMKEGLEQGRILQLIVLTEKGIISAEVAAQEAGMSTEEFITRMQEKQKEERREE